MDPSSQFYMDNKNERRMQETKDSIPPVICLGGNVISTVWPPTLSHSGDIYLVAIRKILYTATMPVKLL